MTNVVYNKLPNCGFLAVKNILGVCYFSLCSMPVVFNLFHTVAHFPTQGNVTTHFGTEL